MQPAKTFSYNAPYHDDRKGLGYGQIKNRFHKPRQSGSDFPYKIDDYEDADFEDEETENAISVKVPTVYATDFGAAAGTDPFYFAAGNVKLSDAFFRTEQLIEAMTTFSDSMSPAPYAYRSRNSSLGRASGSSFTSGVGSSKKTGSRRGFSSAPPLSKMAAVLDYDEDIDEEEEAYTLKDLAKAKTLGV